ncbi:MAG: outer membrane beta-barrel protein [Candidatus Poribacteria bacterium]|nr:outer membrane beta-barrel protein [Candidatus Poribacteria bacterium]
MRVIIVLLSVLLFVSMSQGRVEITPFTGYQTGGELDDATTGATLELKETSNFGFILGFGKEGSGTQTEIFFSRQETELEGSGAFSSASLFAMDVDYYHIGGSVVVNERNNLKPFIAASLGATHFNPEASGVSSETDFSFGIGGGVKYFVSDRIGLRAEARALGTLIERDSAAFCAGGTCLVVGSSDVLWQFNAILGLIIVIP